MPLHKNLSVRYLTFASLGPAFLVLQRYFPALDLLQQLSMPTLGWSLLSSPPGFPWSPWRLPLVVLVLLLLSLVPARAVASLLLILLWGLPLPMELVSPLAHFLRHFPLALRALVG